MAALASRLAFAVAAAVAVAVAAAVAVAVAVAAAVAVELGAIGWRGEVKPDPTGRSRGLSRKRLRPAVISGTRGAPVS
jgi:hypothetical protein